MQVSRYSTRRLDELDEYINIEEREKQHAVLIGSQIWALANFFSTKKGPEMDPISDALVTTRFPETLLALE